MSNLYMGAEGKARTIAGMYIGVNNKARRVNKVYVGINGKARRAWPPSGEIEYYGTTPSNRASGTSGHGAATVGNYAIFAGGDRGALDHTNVVEAYDGSLVKTTAPSLVLGRTSIATAIDNYALFAGGTTGVSVYSGLVEAYDNQLTRTAASSLSNQKEIGGAATLNNRALFGGGRTYSIMTYTSTFYNEVEVLDASFTKSTATNLSVARGNMGTTTIGNYTLFGGGYNDNDSTVVDTYNTSLTKGIATNLSATSTYYAASIGNYALFFGTDKVVDVYNTSLTKTIATSLTDTWFSCVGVLQNYILVPTGQFSDYATIDIYNISLVKTTISTSRKLSLATPATINNYILFPEFTLTDETHPGIVHVFTTE